MKLKSFTILFFAFFVFQNILAAVKFNLSFEVRSAVQGIFTFDIKAQILPGQTWHVGSSNIRLDLICNPVNSYTVHPDNPALNPNNNIHNNGSYGVMTTTSILGGSAISLNIVWNTIGPNYMFNPGMYTLGSIRFNLLDTSGCMKLSFKTNSVLQDSLTQLIYPTDWTFTADTVCYSYFSPGGIKNYNNELPVLFNLYNNYPNPFNPSTKIRFDIAKPTPVKLTVSDILGREIIVIINSFLKPGKYETDFDGSNYASGVYYFRIESSYYNAAKKMVLIK